MREHLYHTSNYTIILLTKYSCYLHILYNIPIIKNGVLVLQPYGSYGRFLKKLKTKSSSPTASKERCSLDAPRIPFYGALRYSNEITGIDQIVHAGLHLSRI